MRELCTTCEAETGRAGHGEDSLYAGDFGPYCEDCWDELRDVQAAEIDRLTKELKAARAGILQLAKDACDEIGRLKAAYAWATK